MQNSVRRLFEISRGDTIGALMHEAVLVPEGRWDWEWLRMLARAVDQYQEWDAERDCRFDAQVGVVPTSDAAVVATYGALELLHSNVNCLVDGDDEGNRYIAELGALPRPPKAIARWPDGWMLEDLIGWILSADAEGALEVIRGVEGMGAHATLDNVVESLKSKDRGNGGTKGDLVTYESLAECISRIRVCSERSRRVLNGLADVLCGKQTDVFVERQDQRVFVFVP
jgi:hypothetical protein